MLPVLFQYNSNSCECVRLSIYFQLTYRYTAGKPAEFAIILAFLAGCVEFAMGVLKLGKSQISKRFANSMHVWK